MAAPNVRTSIFSRRWNWHRLALFAALAYFLLLGGSAVGSLDAVRVFTAVIGAIVVTLWIRALRRSSDFADGLLILALLIYFVACALSRLPRFSFDSAYTALGFAATYGLSRRELADPSARRQLVFLLAGLGAVFAGILAFAWGRQWVDWITLTKSIPPLDLILSALDIYWFKYQLAILLGMLAVFSLALPRMGFSRLLAGVVVAVSLVLIYMSGARSAWVGVGGAALLLVLFGRSSWRLDRRVILGIGTVVLLLIALLYLLGLGQQLQERLLAVSSINLRLDIWQYALKLFWEQPLQGYGPGTFPSLITASGYFQVFDNIGRGPDSAPVQMLAESGFMGAAIALVLAGCLIAATRAGRNEWTPYALAAVVVFCLSSITNDSVHDPQLVMVAVVAAALAGPSSPRETAEPQGAMFRMVGVATYGAAAVAGVGLCFALVAAEIHSAAADASASGRDQQAVDLATLASDLDPRNGYLLREKGLALLNAGDAASALHAFVQVRELSPADMTAARSAAMTASQSGLAGVAAVTAGGASTFRPNDIANLETLVYVAQGADLASTRQAALVQLLRRFPWLPGAPAWSAFAGASVQLPDLIDEAAAETTQSPPDPRRIAERTWLLASDGQSLPSGMPTFDGLSALLDCSLETAEADASSAFDKGTYGPWDTVLQGMLASERGDQSALVTIREVGILRVPSIGVLVGGVANDRSPFSDTGEDVRLYWHIEPGIRLPREPLFPSSDQALAAWIADPRAAAMRGAPQSGLAQCSR